MGSLLPFVPLTTGSCSWAEFSFFSGSFEVGGILVAMSICLIRSSSMSFARSTGNRKGHEQNINLNS